MQRTINQLKYKIMKIKTFEDACEVLKLDKEIISEKLCQLELMGQLGKQLIAICKLNIIRKALNDGWEPNMTEGTIYYSYVNFYKDVKNIPFDFEQNIIGKFITNDQEYLLVGGFADYCSFSGISSYDHYRNVGCVNAHFALLCCKSIKIAEYMSKQFGKLIFEACYAQYTDIYKYIG